MGALALIEKLNPFVKHRGTAIYDEITAFDIL